MKFNKSEREALDSIADLAMSVIDDISKAPESDAYSVNSDAIQNLLGGYLLMYHRYMDSHGRGKHTGTAH